MENTNENKVKALQEKIDMLKNTIESDEQEIVAFKKDNENTGWTDENKAKLFDYEKIYNGNKEELAKVTEEINGLLNKASDENGATVKIEVPVPTAEQFARAKKAFEGKDIRGLVHELRNDFTDTHERTIDFQRSLIRIAQGLEYNEQIIAAVEKIGAVETSIETEENK